MNLQTARATLQGDFSDPEKILNCLLAAAWTNNLSVIKYAEHKFYPMGYTAIILLAESHLSIHTFPEKNEAVIDCLTCGQKAPKPVIIEAARLLGVKIKGKVKT